MQFRISSGLNETIEMKLKILVGSERKKVLPPWLKDGSDK